jgi:uncharacterized protein
VSRTSAFSAHVGDLRRHLGTRKEIVRQGEVSGLTVVDARVPRSAEVAIEAVIESIPDGVVVTGTVSAPWDGICRRCLKEVSGVLQADVREIFETSPTEGETWPLTGDQVDLEDLVRETVLLSLPLAPLCADDCLGPAPDRFPPILPGDEAADADVDGPDGAPVDVPRDPRWAKLDSLRLDE